MLPPSIAMRAGVVQPLRDEVLGGRDEVVEDVLLLLEHAGAVPGLAVLAAAAQVGEREDAAALEQREVAGIEGRRPADVEAAVAVEQDGPLAVRRDVRRDGRGTSRPRVPSFDGYQTWVVWY